MKKLNFTFLRDHNCWRLSRLLVCSYNLMLINKVLEEHSDIQTREQEEVLVHVLLCAKKSEKIRLLAWQPAHVLAGRFA